MWSPMVWELVHHGSRSVLRCLVLLLELLLMMIVLKNRDTMKRQVVVVLSLATIFVASLTVADLFSQYTLDALHILSHAMFSAILLLGAKSLAPEKVPAFFHILIGVELNIFDRFQYILAQTATSLFNRIHDSLELNIFDRFQYILAHTVSALAIRFRRMQTGILNTNLIGIILGLIACLFLLLLLGCVP